jgi:hypothetical protein
MLVPGQVVEVEVRRVAVFGAFCEYDGQELLLLLPETSWVASYCSCDQFAAPGDRLTVKVLCVDATTEQASATVRGLYPDPWADGSLIPGSEYWARVVRYVTAADRCNGQPGYLLEILPGVYVMLCAATFKLERGQRVWVTIRTSEFGKRAVTIGLSEASPNPRLHRNGPAGSN